MQVFTVSDAVRRFGVRREDIVAVADEEEIGRKVGSTFTFTKAELDELEDALEDEGLLAADEEDQDRKERRGEESEE